jgi:hypothetical protein
LSKDNIFGLVRMLGKEPVGALSFLAEAPRGEGAGAFPLSPHIPLSGEVPHESQDGRNLERTCPSTGMERREVCRC